MNLNGTEIVFRESNYNMFGRRAIIAFEKETDEIYGDVTINLPAFPLEDNRVFLTGNSPILIEEMVKQGYLKIHGSVKYNYGTYEIGEFLQKFEDEVKPLEFDEESSNGDD